MAPGAAGQEPAAPARASDFRWFRGNLHTHTLWSDGDAFPELAVEWYRSRGYHFLALTDHNVFPDEVRWIDVAEAVSKGASMAHYREVMGPEWVETRDGPAGERVRLRTPGEVAIRFEVPERFLLVPAEEISDGFAGKQIHVNGANLVRTIPPQGGGSVAEVLANDVAAVRDQGRETGRLVYAQMNHPNFEWALDAGHLAGAPGIDPDGPVFFEVYNGHWLVENDGDATHPSTDRLWDLALVERLDRGAGPVYGVGTDDTHHYHGSGPGGARPGRGWVVVCADTLETESLIRSMLRGDFYASTGVELVSIQVEDRRIRLAIREDGARYRTLFIGTRRQGGPEATGVVLAEDRGTRPGYTLRGDERYVRAKVVSSESMAEPAVEGELKTAWTQPVVMDESGRVATPSPRCSGRRDPDVASPPTR